MTGTPDHEAAVATLARHLEPGWRVAVSDGVGTPQSLVGPLAEAARRVGDVHLVLGWSFWLPDVDWSSFASITTIMGGHALRPHLADGRARYLPVRYGSLGALFADTLPLDALVVAARRTDDGLVPGTEVSWLGPALESTPLVLVEVNHALPAASRGVVLPEDRTVVIAEVERPPIAVPSRPPSADLDRLGAHVASILPEGATVQFAPGAVGTAVLSHLTTPVAIDSGVVTDDVVALARRGLLTGTPTAAYLLGSEELYAWADGRPLLVGIDETHDVSRLGRIPRFCAVNTALQIDAVGQVNVEAVGGDRIGGIGGHADYALGASRSAGGLSIIALTTANRGRSSLVDRLAAPTTTPRSDVDVVVTELGVADLRGLDDPQREQAIRAIYPPPTKHT